MAKLNIVKGSERLDKIWIEHGSHANETRFWFYRGAKNLSAGDIKTTRLGYLIVSHDFESPVNLLDYPQANVDFVPWVLEVWVHPDVRRQGIATQLYVTAIEFFGLLVSAEPLNMEDEMHDFWLSLPYRNECVSVENLDGRNYGTYQERYIGTWNCGQT